MGDQNKRSLIGLYKNNGAACCVDFDFLSDCSKSVLTGTVSKDDQSNVDVTILSSGDSGVSW